MASKFKTLDRFSRKNSLVLKLAVGDIVLVLFPFSDLKGQKLRPALVLAKAEFGNFILCQITSRPYSSKIAIKLSKKDFSIGKLPITSFVRPDKIFTADASIIEKVAGKLHTIKREVVIKEVTRVFTK